MPPAEQLKQLELGATQGFNRLKDSSEAACLAMLRGEYIRAAASFERSFALEEELYTRSLAELGLSSLLNERVRTFRGHYFERWMVQMLAVVNRLAMADREGAKVELRRLIVDLRLTDDPFQEKRLLKAKVACLSLAGMFEVMLGMQEEAFGDLYAAWKEDRDAMPEPIRNTFVSWAKLRIPSNEFGSDRDAALPDAWLAKGRSLQLRVTLRGKFPQRVEEGVQVSLLEYWPVIRTWQDAEFTPEEGRELEDVFLGALGKRVIQLAWPVYRHQTKTDRTDLTGTNLDLGSMMLNSWQLQKNRLIARTAVRVAWKMVAANLAEKQISKASDGDLAVILGQLARWAVWKTERADLRQIAYLPDQIGFDWQWLEEGESLQCTIIDETGYTVQDH